MERIFNPGDKNELLKGWLLHAHKMRDRHDLAARRFSSYNWWLSISATVLSATVGTSVFASLSDIGFGSVWGKITFGVFAMVAAGLAALQASLKLGERAERHRAAGAQFKIIIRCFERISAGSIPHQDTESLLVDLKKRLDVLEIDAPVVPPGIYNQVQDKYAQGKVRYVTTVRELTDGDA